MYIIELYQDKNGNSEIESYLKRLRINGSKDDRIKSNKIRMYIQLLSEHGFSLNEPYIKRINEKIWELRPLKDRILFASVYKNKFILLNIFVKKTKKTPKYEIEKAERILKDYIERSENGGEI